MKVGFSIEYLILTQILIICTLQWIQGPLRLVRVDPMLFVHVVLDFQVQVQLQLHQKTEVTHNMMQYDAKYAKVKKRYLKVYKPIQKYESVCKFFQVVRERKN